MTEEKGENILLEKGLWNETHVYGNVCPAYLTLKRAQYASLTNDRQLREEGRKGGGKVVDRKHLRRDRNMQETAGS